MRHVQPRRRYSLLKALTDYSPTRGTALILAVGMLAWGVWVLLPYVSFTGAVYTLMGQLANEEVWGGLFAFAGLTMGFGVWTTNIEWLRRGAFIGFALWTLVAVLGVIAEPTATAVVTRAIIALMHAWVYVQVNVHPELVSGAVTIPDINEYVKVKKEERTRAQVIVDNSDIRPSAVTERIRASHKEEES